MKIRTSLFFLSAGFIILIMAVGLIMFWTFDQINRELAHYNDVNKMAKDIVPLWIKNRLIESANRKRSSEFLSDRSAFDASFQARLDEIMNNLTQALPIAEESFFAQTAGQGLQGGEVSSQFFRNVVGPLQRGAQLQATTAATEASLGFSQLQSSERIAGEQLDMAALQELVNAIIQSEQSKNAPGSFERIMSGLFQAGGQVAGAYAFGGGNRSGARV